MAIKDARQNIIVKLFRIIFWVIAGLFVLILKVLSDTKNLSIFLFELSNKNKKASNDSVKKSGGENSPLIGKNSENSDVKVHPFKAKRRMTEHLIILRHMQEIQSNVAK